MTEIKSVGIWLRVSTDMQVKDDSPEHHEQRARYYAQSRDWQVVEVYRLEAVSGKTVMEHPETKRMLRDVRSGRITGLVFSKLARLARNTKELLEFADIFRGLNADLVSLSENIDTSTPAGRLFFTIISAMAEWERAEIAERVAASVPVRARLGKQTGGQATYGYAWVDKQLVIDEKEAPIRRLVHELFLKYQRRKATAKALNDLGYRTRNGSEFSDTTIERLLRDPTAKGIRRANYTRSHGKGKNWELKDEKDWVTHSCPAIIDETLWNQCIAILDEQERKRTPSKRGTYLLSGFVSCHCGSPMYVYHPKSGNYLCRNCKNRILETDLNEIYQDHIRQYLTGVNRKQYADEAVQALKEQEQLLATALSERGRLMKRMQELLNMRLNDELTKERFLEYHAPLETQVAQLDEQLPELEADIEFRRNQFLSSDTVLTEAKTLSEAWNDMPLDEMRAIVEVITERIEIGTDSIDITLSYLPDSNRGKAQRDVMDSWRRPTEMNWDNPH